MLSPAELVESLANLDAGIERCEGCGGWVDRNSPTFAYYGCVTCCLLEIQQVRDGMNRW